MAFGIPQFGLGGVLSFDSKPAVTGLNRAAVSFRKVHKLTDRLKGGVARITAGFQKFQMAGLALGGVSIAGITLQVRNLVGQMADYEDMSLRIASTFNVMAGGAQTFDVSMQQAEETMKRIRTIAVETPAETADLVNTFSSIVAPLQNAGQSLENVFTMTKNAALAAKPLGMDYRTMSDNLFRIIEGELAMDMPLTKALRSQKLISESAEEWRGMLPLDRIQRIQEIMLKFGPAGEAAGKSISGLSSTFKDILFFISQSFALPVLNAFRDAFVGLNKNIQGGMDGILKRGAEMGKLLIPFATGMIEGFMTFVGWVRTATGVLGKMFAKVQTAMGDMGIDINIKQLGRWAGIITGIVAILAPIGIIIATIGVVGGAIVTAISAVWPVIGVLVEGFAILGGIIAGLFGASTLKGQKFGSFMIGLWVGIKGSVMAAIGSFREIAAVWIPTLQRAWTSLKPGLMAAIQPVVRFIQTAFTMAFAVVSSFFNLIKRVVIAAAPAFEGIVAAVGQFLKVMSVIFNFLEPVFSGLIVVIGSILIGLDHIRGAIAETVLPVIGVMWALLADVWRIIGAIGMGFASAGRALMAWLSPVTSWIANKLLPLFEAVGKVIGRIGNWIRTQWLTGMKMIGKAMADLLSAVAPLAAVLGLGTVFPKTISALRGVGSPGGIGAVTPTPPKAKATFTDKAINPWGSALAGAQAEQQGAIKCPDINLNNKSQLNVDGKKVASAQSKYKTEVSERSGYSITPWQQRKVLVKATA